MARAPRSYSGVLGAFWILGLVGWGLNVTAVWYGLRTVASWTGVCRAPTHMEFIESLLSFMQPVVASRMPPPNPKRADGAYEGCIVLCNHVNWADFVLDIAFLPRGVYVSRNLLKLVFFPGSLIRDWLFSDMVYFKRGSKDAKKPLYDAVARKCAEGRSVIVYAEGTRNDKQTKKPLKVGLIKLAYDRGIPLYVSMVSNKGGLVDEKHLRVTFGATVRHVVSGLVLPKDHETLESFVAASQGAWDEVWDKIH